MGLGEDACVCICVCICACIINLCLLGCQSLQKLFYEIFSKLRFLYWPLLIKSDDQKKFGRNFNCTLDDTNLLPCLWFLWSIRLISIQCWSKTIFERRLNSDDMAMLWKLKLQSNVSADLRQKWKVKHNNGKLWFRKRWYF